MSGNELNIEISFNNWCVSPSFELVQAVIPPQRDASVGLKRFGEPFED